MMVTAHAGLPYHTWMAHDHKRALVHDTDDDDYDIDVSDDLLTSQIDNHDNDNDNEHDDEDDIVNKQEITSLKTNKKIFVF
jgi:hypothetical protein